MTAINFTPGAQINPKAFAKCDVGNLFYFVCCKPPGNTSHTPRSNRVKRAGAGAGLGGKGGGRCLSAGAGQAERQTERPTHRQTDERGQADELAGGRAAGVRRAVLSHNTNYIHASFVVIRNAAVLSGREPPNSLARHASPRPAPSRHAPPSPAGLDMVKHYVMIALGLGICSCTWLAASSTVSHH